MSRMMRRGGILLMAALLALLTACLNSDHKPLPETIGGRFGILWDTGTGLAPNVYATNLLKARFPDAEFTVTNMSRGYHEDSATYPNEIYEVVKNKVSGDLIMIENTLAPFFFKTGYLEPLDNYVASDLRIAEQLSPELLDKVREQGNGQIYGIPFGKNVYALYYNAEIFNELNVQLPTDGMTWDQVFELASTIATSPMLGGRAALRIPDEHLAYSQFHIRILNPETGEPDAESPLWERRKAFFDKYVELHELNPLDSGSIFKSDFDYFAEGKIAMIVGGLQGSGESRATPGLYPPLRKEWDMVSFPVFSDAPDTGPAASYYYLGILKGSERKREAFQLISYLLSDEPQTSNSINGLASILNTPNVFTRFGESYRFVAGKHVQAYFRHSKEGTLGPDYNWELQKWGSNIYYLEYGKLNEILAYHRTKLEEIGVSSIR